MNKVFGSVLVAAAAMSLNFSNLSSVDAASVAMLPLINNVVEREDLSSIYFDRAIEVAKKADADIVDDSNLDKAIEKYTKTGVLPGRADLEGIAADGNVDVVIAMQVDELSRKDLLMDNNLEYDLELALNGKIVYYNAITNQFKLVKLNESEKMPGSLGARFDVEGDLFANNVTRQVRRALGYKKITIEAPRISRSGQKGNRK